MFGTTTVLAQVVLTAYFLATAVAESLYTSCHQAAQIRMASALRNTLPFPPYVGGLRFWQNWLCQLVIHVQFM